MRRLRCYLLILVAGGLATVGALGCGNADDFTSATLERDITHVYANYLRVQQAAEGHPLQAAPVVSGKCGRGGVFTPSSGAGKDWQCEITAMANGKPTTSRYNVVARPTACYTATSPDFGMQFVQAASGADVANPLYQFDGCVAG